MTLITNVAGQASQVLSFKLRVRMTNKAIYTLFFLSLLHPSSWLEPELNLYPAPSTPLALLVNAITCTTTGTVALLNHMMCLAQHIWKVIMTLKVFLFARQDCCHLLFPGLLMAASPRLVSILGSVTHIHGKNKNKKHVLKQSNKGQLEPLHWPNQDYPDNWHDLPAVQALPCGQ